MLLRKKKKLVLPTEPTVYPIGTCVHTERGYFYMKANSRLRIPSLEILNSYNFHRIAESTERALINYKITGKMGFRSGSLIYNISDGKVYLISDFKRRQVMSPKALRLIGAKYDDAVVVSDEDIQIHEVGEPIN